MADQSPSTGRASLDSVAFVEHTLRRRHHRRSGSQGSSSSSKSRSSSVAESFGSSHSRPGEMPGRSAGHGDGASQPDAVGSGSYAAPWPDVPPPPEPTPTATAAATEGAEAAPAEEQPTRPDPSEDFICRICFDGPGGDDGERLGRLIAPCRCKGTMKFVHTTCLSRWRVLSRRSTSSMACDQCGASYRFKKSPFVGLATSSTLQFLVSIVLFTLLIWTVGFCAELGIRRWGGAEELVGTEVARGGGTQAVRAVLQGVGTRGSSIYDDDDEDDIVGTRGGYYYSSGYGMGYGVPFYAEPLGYASLVKAAVREIAGGGALAKTWRYMGDALGGEDQEEEGEDAAAREGEVHPRDRGSWWDGLKWEWKFGKGGVWEGQDPELKEGGVKHSGDGEDVGSSSAEQGPTKQEQPTLASAPEAAPEAGPPTREESGKADERPSTSSYAEDIEDNEDPLAPSSWLDRIALQFSLGFSLIGILSFLNMLASMAFLGPLHFGNLGLGRGFARLTGGAGGGGRRRGGGDGTTIASVLIGVLRALHAVYKLVGKVAKRMLARIEEAIVDRYGEADEAEDFDDRNRAASQTWSLASLRARIPRPFGFGARRGGQQQQQWQPAMQRGPVAEQQALERNQWLAARAGD